MKHPYNNLLPKHIQHALMSAAVANRIDLIDRETQAAQTTMPHLFHNEKTVGDRRFHNEPRQLVLNAGFNIPYPLSSSSRA